LQDSAYPYHDWNQRINAECYSPNIASRILDSEKRIIDIINNYSKISFNFGPTLLSWMEKYDKDVYQSIIAADRESRENFSGHGAAIAQAYNHLIMPLANARDKRTQVIWGIKDFEYRFGREPEGMWLPETAVDLETLEILAGQGIKFTILAPYQARRVRRIGDPGWSDASEGRIDPQRVYLCRLPSGKTINIFFYDGPISRDIAFGDLLNSGENFANRLQGAFSPDSADTRLVHIATDGETYGHHQHYGEMTLAYFLYYIGMSETSRLTIYGEFLERHPPRDEVEIFENSSWSCMHGVERWRADCGCCSGTHLGWSQRWRFPLRRALDWLRDQLTAIYEKEMTAGVRDPWSARDHYIAVVLDRSPKTVEKFLNDHKTRDLSHAEKVKILKLCEMQRCAMLMYTSCGWFFDDVSGIETVQILRYAARAIQLADELVGRNFENDFVRQLEDAPGNKPELPQGSVVYRKYVTPSVVNLLRVGAHYALNSLFSENSKATQVYSYTATNHAYDTLENGQQKLAVGKVSVVSNITWEEKMVSFAVCKFENYKLLVGVREFVDERAFAKMVQELKEAFVKEDHAQMIQLIERDFEGGSYSLQHLFKDEQRKILYQILDTTLENIDMSLRKINEYHYPIIQVVRQLNIPLPKVLSNMILFMLHKDLLEVFANATPDCQRLDKLVAEIKECSFEIDRVTLEFVVEGKINEMMERFRADPGDGKLLEAIVSILRILSPLKLSLDLWKTQNIYFFIGKKFYADMLRRAQRKDEQAEGWIRHFDSLGQDLKVKVG